MSRWSASYWKWRIGFEFRTRFTRKIGRKFTRARL